MSFIEVAKTSREEWLQWRHLGIGSSDAPVIMGVSRFQKYDELLGKKALPAPIEDTSNGYIKDRGNKIESVVRRLFEEQMGILFPALSCQNVDRPYELATLDGIDAGRNLIIEIKLLATVNPDKPNFNTEGCKKWDAAKQGKIPVDYYPQVQHQLSVTGAPACVFIGLREMKRQAITWEDLAVTTVFPDTEYILDMRGKQKIFFDQVLKLRAEYDNVYSTGGKNE